MSLPQLSSLVADKRTLVQRIMAAVRDGLVKGDLVPGDRLPSETELIKQFGVGRTSVREAMRGLVALGVIEIRRGDGTFVANGDSLQMLNPVEFSLLLEGQSKELLEFRRIIDLGCCSLVIQKATEADEPTPKTIPSPLRIFQ